MIVNTNLGGHGITLGSGNWIYGITVSNTPNGQGFFGASIGDLTIAECSKVGTGGAADLTQSGGTANVQFGTLSSSSSPTHGLRWSGLSGTFLANSGTINSPTSSGIVITGGTANITYPGGVTNNGANRLIDIQNHTGGTLTFNGALAQTNSNGGGIYLNANTGSTNLFNGFLGLNTGTNSAFAAINSGTITATNANNTLTTTNATALNVTNTIIGAAGLKFQRISSLAGTATGIVLDSTGAGGFTVTGTGTAGSGGTIANKTGADNSTTTGIGIYLKNCANISVTNMQLNDLQNFAIRGSNVTALTLSGIVVNGTNGSAATEAAVFLENLLGSASVNGCTFSGGAAENFRVNNSSGTLNRITFTGDTFGTNNTSSGAGNLFLLGTGSATVNASVANCTFSGGSGYQCSLITSNSSAGDLQISNSTATNAQSLRTGGNFGIQNRGSGSVTYTISGCTLRDAVSDAIFLNNTSSGTLSGTVQSSLIGSSSVASSGSSNGSGINASLSAGTQRIRIQGNQISQYASRGIYLNTGVTGFGTLEANITGNTLANPVAVAADYGIYLFAGNVPNDISSVCFNMANNIMTGSGPLLDFRLRQASLTTVRLPGYTGANTNNAAVVSFEQAQNGGAIGTASNTVGLGGFGFQNTPVCNTP